MANLIDRTYFINDIDLPGTVLQGDYEVISQYIAKYEPEVLTMLLGYDLYKDFKAQIDANVFTAPWTNLKNGAEYTVDFGGSTYTIKWNGLINSSKQSLIAYYVYYQYMRDTISQTSGIGEVLNTGENSARISPSDKMAHAWNKFVELYGNVFDSKFIPSAYRYLYENESDFDLWVFEPVEKLNTFGL